MRDGSVNARSGLPAALAWCGLLCLLAASLACDPSAGAAGAAPAATPTRVAVVLVNGKPAPTPGTEPDGQTSSGCFCFDR
jgi:hypothetical protein